MPTPRRKRMTREGRLQSARHAFPDIAGDRSSIRWYAKHHGVDYVCAVTELRMLGAVIDVDYVAQLFQSLMARRPRRASREEEPLGESDEWHSFIAGYTENGFSYGIPWDAEDG